MTKLNAIKLRNAIQRVLTEDSYLKNAIRMQQAIREAGGVKRAADIIEQVVCSDRLLVANDR